MFEARIEPASVLKRLVDVCDQGAILDLHADDDALVMMLTALKDLVSESNWECSDEGLTIQGMDTSHVALVMVKLDRSGFAKYRCDCPIPLGVQVESLKWVLKAAKDDDTLNMKATDNAGLLNLVFETKNSDRTTEYGMKLMDIGSANLGTPDAVYDAQVTMASADSLRICKDLLVLGDNVKLAVKKECITFSLEGDMANGSVSLKQSEGARIKYASQARKQRKERAGKRDAMEVDKRAATVKGSDDVDYETISEEEDQLGSEDEPKKPMKGSKLKGKTKKSRKKDDEGEREAVRIKMNSSVSLVFSLRILNVFAKGASLVDTVTLKLHNDLPLMVQYGQITFYLAPKVGDD